MVEKIIGNFSKRHEVEQPSEPLTTTRHGGNRGPLESVRWPLNPST
jgi:hypothetical protein